MPYRDPERRRAYGREWIKRNPELAREAMRRWRRRHRDEHNEDRRLHYQRHREAELARGTAYRRVNPEVYRAARTRRRARELGADGSFTAAEWRALVRQYGGCCAYCNRPGALHAEHRLPLSRGGSNGIENILPACAVCNVRKHTLTEEEFRRRLGEEGRQKPIN